MGSDSSEFERTIGFGEAALERIRAFRHSAQPKNYEFWFTYATGFNASLNETVNEIIASGRPITPEEADTLYQLHITPSHLSQKMEQMSGMIVDEINQVMAMIDVARDSASAYDQSLNGLEQTLGKIEDLNQIRLVIESLVQATREMQEANALLEERMMETRREMLALQINMEAIRAESLTDSVTEISNRKYFDAALEKMLLEARSDHRSFSLLMIDIDHFKTFNDTYGHLVGDQVLRAVASVLRNNTKGQDVAARYGGEEFAVLLPDTPLRSAITLADNIRRMMSVKELIRPTSGQRLGRLTISIGVASFRDDDTAQSLLERSDRCLYAAKRCGRNRVISETDPEAVMPISDRSLA